MKAMEFARQVIEGPGGMNDYEAHEIVAFDNSDRVSAAHWMLKCLANPDCEGSREAVEAILEARGKADGRDVIPADWFLDVLKWSRAVGATVGEQGVGVPARQGPLALMEGER